MHGFQVFPQDLSSGAVWDQSKEAISVQAAEFTSSDASQIRPQALQAKFSLAPV